MRPDATLTTLDNNIPRIKKLLLELVLRPRRDLAKWAELTKQTPNIKIGYSAQHFASLVTGVEGTRTGARGHDLRDGSEVKSCSRVDQLDKCRICKAAVARIEVKCPKCKSTNVERKKDSKWLLSVKNETELTFLLRDVPRIVLILSDYPHFADGDWHTLQFQIFELWPSQDRHINFRTLMEEYYYGIYEPHIQTNPQKTPAPKNFWPYSFQFYMCNPLRTFHCIVTDALKDPQIDVRGYVEPATDRAAIDPVSMPFSTLKPDERTTLRHFLGAAAYAEAKANGLTEKQRLMLRLRDTSHATPHNASYRRGRR